MYINLIISSSRTFSSSFLAKKRKMNNTYQQSSPSVDNITKTTAKGRIAIEKLQLELKTLFVLKVSTVVKETGELH